MAADPRVFICYRRADAEAWAGRLFDRLAAEFGTDRVFLDVEAVRPGEDFVAAIGRALEAVDAVLAVIGPTWATARAADGRPSLENPQDYVRMELALALQREVRVIPVLVGGAVMPGAGALPPDLGQLTRLNALAVTHAHFGDDSDRLVEALRPRPPEATPAARRRWPGVRDSLHQGGAWVSAGPRLGRLVLAQLLAVLTVLGVTVALPYASFAVTMWAYLVLAVNGVALGLTGERRGGRSTARFGWTGGVACALLWGLALVFPRSLGLTPLVESWAFEMGFRLFVLSFGAVTAFMGLRALVEIRRRTGESHSGD